MYKCVCVCVCGMSDRDGEEVGLDEALDAPDVLDLCVCV